MHAGEQKVLALRPMDTAVPACPGTAVLCTLGAVMLEAPRYPLTEHGLGQVQEAGHVG